jgi:nitrate reductase NapD
MSKDQPRYYVSSAVIVVKPLSEVSVGMALRSMERVEVHASEGGKIIVVIEGHSSGQLGATLSDIFGIPGVVAANMVYEHSENEESLRDEHRTNAA